MNSSRLNILLDDGAAFGRARTVVGRSDDRPAWLSSAVELGLAAAVGSTAALRGADTATCSTADNSFCVAVAAGGNLASVIGVDTGVGAFSLRSESSIVGAVVRADFR
ncbi:hypothetical protein GN244_ATG06930 [Phytophthora infestans]|uniref:Uncharacterized protein n=1 Tax=Phytophthora infestans TaxID=4787 RepID=A0A833SX41_PHYIN|nr:hypothetical protein GN244_ATG06930 [Phytophthora infestans]